MSDITCAPATARAEPPQRRPWPQLVEAARVLVNDHGWALGDLACEVETSYGENKLQKFADEIGVEYNTLRSYRKVARAWPESDGRPSSLGVAEALAAQEDRHNLIAADPAMTVARARQIVQERRQRGMAVASRDEPSAMDEDEGDWHEEDEDLIDDDDDDPATQPKGQPVNGPKLKPVPPLRNSNPAPSRHVPLAPQAAVIGALDNAIGNLDHGISEMTNATFDVTGHAELLERLDQIRERIARLEEMACAVLRASA